MCSSPRTTRSPFAGFERMCNHLNRSRAAFYGRSYSESNVVYYDVLKAKQEERQIVAALRKHNLPRAMQRKPRTVYTPYMNNIMIRVHNFDDKKTDLFWVLRFLFHEMNHTGSVIRIRKDQSDETFPTKVDCCGAKMNTQKLGIVGEVLGEEYNLLEEGLLLGKHQSLKEKDPFLKDFPLFEKIVSGANSFYTDFSQNLIAENGLVIPPNGRLTMYHKLDRVRLIKLFGDNRSSDYFAYEFEYGLVDKIIKRHPELFNLLRDFIYGGRMAQCARAFDAVYGKGFFRKLLTLNWNQVEEFSENI